RAARPGRRAGHPGVREDRLQRLSRAGAGDGRAATIEEAIAQHGGEGIRARDRFLRLSRFERTALLQFLRSL
ncbi:MAG TPA: di-heme oxidoredictase family protein, partial [Gemmatimonadales bacterium]|nr:di-heme oxidoredictase family protein [Gemmatimonadales bacterium]